MIKSMKERISAILKRFEGIMGYKMCKITPRLAVLITAVFFGMIEAFAFDHGLHPGSATLLSTFVAAYHLPIAGLMLLICLGYGQWQMFPAWIFAEDLTFFLISKQYILSPDSWVSAGLGGIHLSAQVFLPFTYLILLALWLLLEWTNYKFIIKFGLYPEKKL